MSHAKPTILIVDDERYFVDLLVQELQADYDLVTVKSGEEALARAASDQPPDLILLDITLPDMDGFEVCRRFQSDPDLRDIPVIFLSSRNELEDEKRGLGAGAVDVITKPINPPILRARVENQLALAGARRQLARQNEQLEQRVRERTEALYNSEARLRNILDATTAVIYVKDKWGRYVLVNRQYEALFHISNRAIAGKSDYDIFPLKDADVFYANDLQVLEADEAQEFEEVMVLDDGPHTFLSIKFPLRNLQGDIYGVCGVSTDITARKQAEEELYGYKERLRLLATEISLAEERERRRISANLHDGPIQRLALSKIRLGILGDLLTTPEQRAVLGEIRDLLEQSIRESRSLMVQLSPPVLYELGLEAAVEWLAERFCDQHAIPCEVVLDSNPKPLGDELKVVLFQAVRELLLNVVKHARAGSATVTVEKEEGFIRIEVEDDGVGFDPERSGSDATDTGGFGLFSLRDRLDLVGGRMAIESGQGTRVTLWAPLVHSVCG